MDSFPEGNAIVYCQGAYGTITGKTANGLVRRSQRYRVLSVIDSRHAGKDAGGVLDGRKNGIPIFGDLDEAATAAARMRTPATHFVMGLAPDGGRLGPSGRAEVVRAVRMGLHIVAGLHDHFSIDPGITRLAAERGVTIIDVRKPPPLHELHVFSGKIAQVDSLKIAVLGADSACGKRTTSWILLDALAEAGYTVEFVGTGQTAWMQGARYGIVLDSLVNDFVSGELEHAVWRAWNEMRPDVIIIEGQGSLMHPAYPGGFEILAAGRPDVVVYQDVPARREYDGLAGYVIHPVKDQIKAIEVISGKPVVAVTVNHEGMTRNKLAAVCRRISESMGLPATDPLWMGVHPVVTALLPYLKSNRRWRTGGKVMVQGRIAKRASGKPKGGAKLAGRDGRSRRAGIKRAGEGD